MEIPFTNREIAIAILIAGFCSWAIRFKPVRSSLKSIAKTALNPSLFIPVVLIGLWISFGVFLLERLGLWDPSLLKETIMWSLFTGVALLFDVAASKEPNRSFGENLSKQFKWAVALSFFINLISFPLLIELPLIALMVLTGLSLEVSKLDEKHQLATRFLEGLLEVLGWVLLAGVAWSIFKTPSQLFSVQTAKTFLLPIALIFWTLPFAYLVAINVAYDSLFRRIELKRWQERSIRFYTTVKILRTGHVNASRVNRMGQLLCRKTDDLKLHSQVDGLFTALKECLKDPENNDSRDFIWPEPTLFGGEVRYASLEDYLQDTAPLHEHLDSLWESTTEAFSEFSDETQVPPVLEKFLISKWEEVSEVRQRIDELDRAPIIAEYFDQELRMFSADLRQIYWYSSPENPSQEESYRLGYIVFSNFNRAGKQYERLLRATRKLHEQMPLD